MQTETDGCLLMGHIDESDLVMAFEDAVEEELKNGADICDYDDWWLLAIDKDGERITGDAVGYYEENPTLELIEKTFEEYPDAVCLILEGSSYRYAEGEDEDDYNRDNLVPFGWWNVTIHPDSLTPNH